MKMIKYKFGHRKVPWVTKLTAPSIPRLLTKWFVDSTSRERIYGHIHVTRDFISPYRFTR